MSSWKYRPNLIILIFSLCAWYLGCVCGSILCAILIKTWTKKQLYVSLLCHVYQVQLLYIAYYDVKVIKGIGVYYSSEFLTSQSRQVLFLNIEN